MRLRQLIDVIANRLGYLSEDDHVEELDEMRKFYNDSKNTLIKRHERELNKSREQAAKFCKEMSEITRVHKHGGQMFCIQVTFDSMMMSYVHSHDDATFVAETMAKTVRDELISTRFVIPGPDGRIVP